MASRPLIITIDGPGGAGKSTLARELAKRLSWLVLDTGAIYRALAFTLREMGLIDPSPELASQVAQSLELEFQMVDSERRLLLAGRDLGEAIRTPEISRLASFYSAWPEVRQALLPLQRAQAQKGPLVAEGRDMGTVVFPEAPLRIFLEASPETRARRVYEDLRRKGAQVSYERLVEELRARDRSDSTRDVAPLVKSPGVVVIDSSSLSLDETLALAWRLARETFGVIIRPET
ncbi:MAG: (d)CMP kinase [Deltaproteobacteria bacterium]|jgi:cytidylate kinase|nr:(d)CMP kinase [Deltaproteobacteria bacterium]